MTDSVVHHRIEKGLVIFFGLNFQSGCSVIMRLTQVLLRKRKMNTKGDRFVRNWQWNNAWYLNQERKVFDIGQKAAAEARGGSNSECQIMVGTVLMPSLAALTNTVMLLLFINEM